MTSLELFYCTEITDVGCSQHLSALSQLNVLSIGSCDRITDIGFSHLPRLSSLSEQSLWNGKVTDVGVAHFSEWTHLTSLSFGDCLKITSEALVCLKNLKNLQRLCLARTCVREVDGLVHLEGLSQLEHVDLSGLSPTDMFTSLGSVGFASLAKLLNLKSLYLQDRIEFAPHCLRDLQKLPFLHTISLKESTVSDEMVDDLLTLQHLTTLHLEQARISEHNYNRLREGLPACQLAPWDPTQYVDPSLPYDDD